MGGLRVLLRELRVGSRLGGTGGSGVSALFLHCLCLARVRDPLGLGEVP